MDSQIEQPFITINSILKSVKNRRRNLQKRLRKIVSIEDRCKNGDKLDFAQINTLACKSQVESEVSVLKTVESVITGERLNSDKCEQTVSQDIARTSINSLQQQILLMKIALSRKPVEFLLFAKNEHELLFIDKLFQRFREVFNSTVNKEDMNELCEVLQNLFAESDNHVFATSNLLNSIDLTVSDARKLIDHIVSSESTTYNNSECHNQTQWELKSCNSDRADKIKVIDEGTQLDIEDYVVQNSYFETENALHRLSSSVSQAPHDFVYSIAPVADNFYSWSAQNFEIYQPITIFEPSLGLINVTVVEDCINRMAPEERFMFEHMLRNVTFENELLCLDPYLNFQENFIKSRQVNSQWRGFNRDYHYFSKKELLPISHFKPNDALATKIVQAVEQPGIGANVDNQLSLSILKPNRQNKYERKYNHEICSEPDLRRRAETEYRRMQHYLKITMYENCLTNPLELVGFLINEMVNRNMPIPIYGFDDSGMIMNSGKNVYAQSFMHRYSTHIAVEHSSCFPQYALEAGKRPHRVMNLWDSERHLSSDEETLPEPENYYVDTEDINQPSEPLVKLTPNSNKNDDVVEAADESVVMEIKDFDESTAESRIVLDTINEETKDSLIEGTEEYDSNTIAASMQVEQPETPLRVRPIFSCSDYIDDSKFDTPLVGIRINNESVLTGAPSNPPTDNACVAQTEQDEGNESPKNAKIRQKNRRHLKKKQYLEHNMIPRPVSRILPFRNRVRVDVHEPEIKDNESKSCHGDNQPYHPRSFRCLYCQRSRNQPFYPNRDQCKRGYLEPRKDQQDLLNAAPPYYHNDASLTLMGTHMEQNIRPFFCQPRLIYQPTVQEFSRIKDEYQKLWQHYLRLWRFVESFNRRKPCHYCGFAPTVQPIPIAQYALPSFFAVAANANVT